MALPSNSTSSQDVSFNYLHKIDRQLYTILAINIGRDPMEALLIMAFWLWLERLGFRNIVSRMLPLPVFVINELANEAMQALGCIASDHPPTSSSSDNNNNLIIPLTQIHIKNEIPLECLYANRQAALEGMTRVYNDVCIRAMKDLVIQAMNRRKTLPPPSPPLSSTTVDRGDLMTQVPAEERTMFVTFSKGYPIQESEVREFFTMNYGDCIEMLRMQEVKLDEQALFAHIVFRSAATIDLILTGRQRKKFTFNGKHICAQKSIPKQSARRPPPAPPCLPGNGVGK